MRSLSEHPPDLSVTCLLTAFLEGGGGDQLLNQTPKAGLRDACGASETRTLSFWRQQCSRKSPRAVSHRNATQHRSRKYCPAARCTLTMNTSSESPAETMMEWHAGTRSSKTAMSLRMTGEGDGGRARTVVTC